MHILLLLNVFSLIKSNAIEKKKRISKMKENETNAVQRDTITEKIKM